MFANLSIWSEQFWLPPNMTWKQFENPPNGEIMTKVNDFWVLIPIAVLLHLLRLVIEKKIMKPIGLWFGLRDTSPKKITPSKELERAFKKKKRPTEEEIKELAVLANKTERSTSNWFRKRRNNEKSSYLNKFCESGWRFCFYFSISTFGVSIMYNKNWFWTTAYCWIDFPWHSLPSDIHWYIMIELGYYASASISIFFDVKRKDFVEMLSHHLITMVLVLIAYVGNFFRITSLVLVIHDVSDYWMEAAKMAKYVQLNRLCDALFFIFALSWFVTRLYLYPVKILHTTMIEGPAIAGFFYGVCYVIVSGLLILQLLHLFWFYLIMKIVVQVARYGQVINDSRSDSEISFSDGDEEVENNNVPHTNGVKKTE